MIYTPLEPSSASSLGSLMPTFNSADPSLFNTVQFIYVLSFSCIVVAAFYRYVLAGIKRMQASESAIRSSNEIFKQTTLGLLGIFSLFLILSLVNKDMLTGDINLKGLEVSGAVAKGSGGGASGSTVPTQSQTGTSVGGSAPSKSCDSPENVKQSLTSSGGICGGTSCSALSGCPYQQYLSIIKSEASKAGVDYKMVVVTMCKESKANPSASGNNSDGTRDCGLMQINRTGACDAAIMDPQTNIAAGITLMKGKIAGATNDPVYAGFPNVNGIPVAGVFANYNCCSNGTRPNSPSSQDSYPDGSPKGCKTSDGWPTIPKWACPIDPGTSSSNMCAVKAYACELSNCLSQVP